MSESIFSEMLPALYSRRGKDLRDETLLGAAHIVFTPDISPGCVMALIGIM